MCACHSDEPGRRLSLTAYPNSSASCRSTHARVHKKVALDKQVKASPACISNAVNQPQNRPPHLVQSSPSLHSACDIVTPGPNEVVLCWHDTCWACDALTDAPQNIWHRATWCLCSPAGKPCSSMNSSSSALTLSTASQKPLGRLQSGVRCTASQHDRLPGKMEKFASRCGIKN
jgi:hypothetical protein